MPANHSEPVKSRTDIPDDEIELIDLLRVIWKWKYLMLAGTFCAILIGAIISWNMEKIYQGRMVLKPGITKMEADGKPVYIDQAGDIASLINSELKFKVIDHFKDRNQNSMTSLLDYKIKTNEGAQTLIILYETPDIEKGIENLNVLSNLLIRRYDKKLKHLENNYEHQIMTANLKLKLKKDEEQFIKLKIDDLQQRLDKFTQEIGALNNYSESHTKSPNALLNYAALVEKVADLKQKYSSVSLQIAYLKDEIAVLENEKNSIQAIEVIHLPTFDPHPLKPNIRFIIVSAAIAGLFMMVVLSFFFEYISKHNRQKSD